MKTRLFLFTGAFLLGMMSASQAQEAGEDKQVEDANSMPLIKSLLYGFDVRDIARGLDQKIDIELSGTFTSKHIWHGLDLLDDHGAFIPVGTIILGDSGFSAKIIDVYPLSSGFERSVERNYAGFYTGTFLKGTSWATHFTANYFYYGKPKVGGRRGDAQEMGSTFFWPDLISVGDHHITPTYYLGYIWASKRNSNIRGCEGFIHVFGLGYDLEIPEFWPSGDNQTLRLSGDITYNDGFAGSGIKHDWSHAVLGMSTNIGSGKITMSPYLHYQISMDDSVNNEEEIWCGINFTYRF